MNAINEPDNSSKPVAYDANGVPLFHHPPKPESVDAEQVIKRTQVNSKPESIEGHNFSPHMRTQYANEQKVVHTSRPLDPQHLVVGEDLEKRHRKAVAQYPHLNLSAGEYVILDIKRHPIGMLTSVSITIALLVAIFSFVVFYSSLYDSGISSIMLDPESVFTVAVAMSVLSVMGGALALWVYLQNQFFMTNESVIQYIQESPFGRHEQTVSLGSIEDASFRQTGVLQTILDYGTIRLSTEGEETTYVFRYVTSPKKQVAILNNAVEDFKNGRPVTDPNDN